MRIYISGRMSGLSESDIRERFGRAEQTLRNAYRVSNPARWRWFLRHLPYKVCLAFDLLMMCRCDAVYMLEGWTLSDGATCEHTFACATGMLRLYER